jgi:hypothetical protein
MINIHACRVVNHIDKSSAHLDLPPGGILIDGQATSNPCTFITHDSSQNQTQTQTHAYIHPQKP